MKKRMVSGRLLSLSASYRQGSGMAATGPLIALFLLLQATQTLLTCEL